MTELYGDMGDGIELGAELLDDDGPSWRFRLLVVAGAVAIITLAFVRRRAARRAIRPALAASVRKPARRSGPGAIELGENQHAHLGMVFTDPAEEPPVTLASTSRGGHGR